MTPFVFLNGTADTLGKVLITSSLPQVRAGVTIYREGLLHTNHHAPELASADRNLCTLHPLPDHEMSIYLPQPLSSAGGVICRISRRRVDYMMLLKA